MSLIVPGKTYYVIHHVYHHFLGELVEITGKREGDFRHVVRVHSCARGWEEFFRDGCLSDTTLMHFTDGNMSWQSIFLWPHPIPEVQHHAAQRRAR